MGFGKEKIVFGSQRSLYFFGQTAIGLGQVVLIYVDFLFFFLPKFAFFVTIFRIIHFDLVHSPAHHLHHRRNGDTNDHDKN